MKFSFIMSIPAILGACVLKLPEFVTTVGSEEPALLLTYLAGALAAGIVGVASMKLLQFIAKNKNFRIFSVYSLAAGIFAIILNFILK